MAKKCQINECENSIKRHLLCMKHRDAARHIEKYQLKSKRTCSACPTKIGHNSVRGLCPICIRKADANKDATRARQYYQNNKEKVALYRKSKYNSDLSFRLKAILRSRLNIIMKKSIKTGSAVKDLGCSIEELKSFLASQFQSNMSWSNYGRKEEVICWEIDHIIPLDSFDLTDREQFLKACHYTNLQPLWAEDNHRKSNKNGT